MKNRILTVVVGLAVAAGLALLGASTAGASAHNLQPQTGDTTTIQTENGAMLCVGYNTFGAGNPVIQKGSQGCSPMHEIFVTEDIEHFPEYRFSFNNPATVYMAATNDCTRVTQKGDPNANGTVWIIYTAPNGNQYLVPRFCVGIGEYDKQMGSDNVIGHQWQVTQDLNLYRALILALN